MTVARHETPGKQWGDCAPMVWRRNPAPWARSHAERLFGDPDYLVRVATASLAAYQALRDEKLAALPGVQRLTSTIVMKRVVADRPYPT